MGRFVKLKKYFQEWVILAIVVLLASAIYKSTTTKRTGLFQVSEASFYVAEQPKTRRYILKALGVEITSYFHDLDASVHFREYSITLQMTSCSTDLDLIEK